MSNISLISSFASFLYFSIITTLYFILKIFSKTDKMVLIWTIIYFFVLLVTQFFINVSISKSLCGTNQYITAMNVTFVPWVIILGSLKMLLTIFPGWLSPFSNTFGYLVTKLLGIGNVFNKILSDKFDDEHVKGDLRIAMEALEHIYSDKSLLINEITPANFDTFWNRMSNAKLFKADAGIYKDKLLSLVKLKDTISEFIWYILTGGLVTSISYNYMVNSECSKSVNEIEMLSSEVKNNANALDTKRSESKEMVYVNS